MSVNTVATLRAHVYSVLTTLDGVSNIGVVHDYERWALHLSDVLSVLRDPTDGVARAWWVKYGGFSADEDSSFTTTNYANNKSMTKRDHTFYIRGVLAVDDSAESEKTFATSCETIANALDSDETLHDADSYWGADPCSPASLTVFEERSLAGVLVHWAELTIVVSGIHVGGS